MRKTSGLLLGIWLILNAVVPLLKVNIPYGDVLLAALAVVAGVAIIVEGDVLRLPANLGFLLLGGWLVAGGVMVLFDIGFAYARLVMAAIGVAAGVSLLVRR